MAATGGGDGTRDSRPARVHDDANPNVADMLKKLNLTEEEGEYVAFSDDEADGEETATEWALVGKVISPGALNKSTIMGALKPAWGNPYGLKLRSIGEKTANLFVAEFGSKEDKDRILGASPWVFGKYSVILREYDHKLKPSEIHFDRMEIRARLIDVPLGWMNQQHGARAMGLLGEVVRMDVDGEGKASGPFLRARVAIDISKPIRRGALIKRSKNEPPEWFDAQYERLSYFCRSCGVLGHSDLVCETPAPRDAEGKLPYDVKLRVEDKKKKLQSFAEAAAESSGSKQSRESTGKPDDRKKDNTRGADEHELEGDATSPLKTKSMANEKGKDPSTRITRPLFQAKKGEVQKTVRKRKSKTNGPAINPAPGLNLPPVNNTALVPAGLVNARVSQLDRGGGGNEDDMEEMIKKQRRSSTTNIASSAAAAEGSPRRAQ